MQIPINSGTSLGIDTQINNSRLKGGFVSVEGIKLLPVLSKELDLFGIKQVHSTLYKNRLFAFTNEKIYLVDQDVITVVADISASNNYPIITAENQNNQITVTTGTAAYVIDQKNNNTVTKLGPAQNFDLTNPVYCLVQSTISIILGGTDLKWTYSDANNALNYNNNDIKDIDPNAGVLVGAAELNNNIYIFSSNYNQKWTISPQRTIYSSPFIENIDYKDAYGCLSGASIVWDKNYIFYLTNNNQIRMITRDGALTFGDERDKSKSGKGISNLISNYKNINNASGILYYHKEHYLYQLSFEENSFIYCIDTQTWSESDKNILAYDKFAVYNNGLYNFSTDYTTSNNIIEIQTAYINQKNIDPLQRVTFSKIVLNVTQGKDIISKKNMSECYLKISNDNVQYGNSLRRQFASVANRNTQLVWNLNATGFGFSFNFLINTKSDITILNCTANILK